MDKQKFFQKSFSIWTDFERFLNAFLRKAVFYAEFPLNQLAFTDFI